MKPRFLLDTQTFLFVAQDLSSLSSRAKAALLNKDHFLFLSLISLWEIQIKIAVKKLVLFKPLQETLQQAVTDLGLELLPIQLSHIYGLNDFPLHHRDPFDRLLIAQALNENMQVIGNDSHWDAYGVKRVW